MEKFYKVLDVIFFTSIAFFSIFGIISWFKFVRPPVQIMTVDQIVKRVEEKPVYYDLESICTKLSGTLVKPVFDDNEFTIGTLGGNETFFSCKYKGDMYSWNFNSKTFTREQTLTK